MKRLELKPGEKYGRWEVLEPAPSVNGLAMYKCKCECGTVKNVNAKNLRYGKTTSCGCYMRERVKETAEDRTKDKNKVDLTGQKFGHLTVVKKANEKIGVNGKWLCTCDCGNTTTVRQWNLTSGTTTSCGHVKKNNSATRIKQSLGLEEGTNVSKILSKKIHSNNSSGVRGVSYAKRKGKYQAYIGFKGKVYSLGYFNSLEEAAEIRKKAENEVYGNFLKWYGENIKIDKNKDTGIAKKIREKNAKGIKGVSYHNRKGKYIQAYIVFEKKKYSLGYYNSLEEAAEIRERAENEIRCGNFEKWYSEYAETREQKQNERKISYLPGQIVGNWEIIEPVEGKTGNYYRCKCIKCKEEKEMMAKLIAKPKTYACNNCRNTDLTGKVFNNVKVLEKIGGNGTNTIWLCECLLCGKKWNVVQFSITSGNLRSCGCYIREISKKVPEYVGIMEGTNVSRMLSSKKSKNNTSGITGVSYNKITSNYKAYIGFKGKLYHLGTFDTLEDAANARKEAECMLYNNFLEWFSEKYPEQWERLNRKKPHQDAGSEQAN